MSSGAAGSLPPIGSVSIVPSFDPHTDCKILSKLFPKRFTALSSHRDKRSSNIDGVGTSSLQSQSSFSPKSALLLRGLGSTPSLLLKNCCHPKNDKQLIQNQQQQQQEQLLPQSSEVTTILVFDRDEILSASSMLQLEKIDNASICFVSEGKLCQRFNNGFEWGSANNSQLKKASHAAILTLFGNNNEKNVSNNNESDAVIGSTLLLVTSDFTYDTDTIETVLKLVADTNINERNENNYRITTPINNGASSLENVGSFSSAAPVPFPTLEVSALSKAQKIGLNENVESPAVMTKNFPPLNTRSGTPFETDLFKGKLLFVARPTDPATNDPYWNERIFSKKRRTVELQIQGQFKRVPTGIIYCGGEVMDRMKLGLVAKGLCNILLKLISTISSNMHYSYGDKNGTDTAHIVFPAWTSMDSLVITKPGENIPPMGEPFPESKACIKERKDSNNHAGNWNTTDIFSMSFHSMYIDLPNWKLINLGVLRDTDLRTFWSESAMRLVIYEKGQHCSSKGSTNKGDESKHFKDQNSYVLSLQFRFLGEQQSTQKQNLVTLSEEAIETERIEEEHNEVAAENENFQLTRSVYSSNNLALVANGRYESPTKLSAMNNSQKTRQDYKSMDSGITNYFDAEDSLDVDVTSNSSEMGDISLESEAEELIIHPSPGEWTLQTQLIPHQHHEFCLGWMDLICAKKKRISYTRVYSFSFPGCGRARFHPAFTFHKMFNNATPDVNSEKQAVETLYSPRLSQHEKQRRVMGRTLERAFLNMAQPQKEQQESEKSKAARSFSRLKTSNLERNFLQRPAPTIHYSDHARTVGFVARALNERHFVEEWVEVTENTISFYHPDKSNPKFRIGVRNIIEVKRLSPMEKDSATNNKNNNCPRFPGFYFLSIETIGRTAYLMFDDDSCCNNFLECLQEMQAVTSSSSSPPSNNNDNNLDIGRNSFVDMIVQDPTEEFLHRSSMWQIKQKQKQILNCKKFNFNSPNDATVWDGLVGDEERCDEQQPSSAVHGNNHQQHPCKVVETALINVFQCKEDDSGNDEALRNFLNSASDLKSVDIRSLPENERIAFFLNLYHVMVMHTFLVLGAPDSALKAISYFGMIAYQVSDEIFSLTELEHCIIRGGMSRPSKFLARLLFIPNSSYPPQIALTRSDYRINFALNCGSITSPEGVPIYRADTLDMQLDENARYFLQATTKIKKSSSGIVSSSLSIALPKVCQWYADDFGKGKSADCIRSIEKYLSSENREMLQSVSSVGKHTVPFKSHQLNVKFLSYSFVCRSLSLMSE